MTLQECLEQYQDKGITILINDGQIIGSLDEHGQSIC